MRIKKTVKKHNNNTSKKSTTLKKHLRTQKGGGQLLDVINNNELSGEEIYKQVNQLLQNNDVDVDETDDDGTTPLIIASYQGRIEMVEALITAGADKDKSDNDGYTPIFWASYNGHLEVVQALIAAGADKDKSDNDGYTPIYGASQYGHLEVVQALLAAGADVNKADNDGYTPISRASIRGHLEVVQALLAAGADVSKADNDGRTPIYAASYKGHLEVVQALVAAGADVNRANNDGWTPISVASVKGHLEVVQALIAAGADVNRAGNDGWTPIYGASYMGHLEVVQALIAAGANVNKADNNGSTPISRASRNSHLEVVQALIAAGADVNKADDKGVTPLYAASQKGRVDIVRVLLERGADITKTFNKKTPLMIAEKKGHMAVVQLLEERGYDTEMESESEEEIQQSTRRSGIKRKVVDYSEQRKDAILKSVLEMPSKKQQRLEEKQQKHRNKIAYSGQSIDTLYNEMYDLVEDLNSKVLNIDGREVPIEYLNKQGLDKLTEDIFPAALGKLQKMVDSFSRDIDKSADIQIESDISTLVNNIQGINYKDIVEGEGTRSTGHNKLIKLLFDEKLYLKGKGIDYRKFFEPSNTGTQCYNMFGSNWQDTKDCYICGVRKANQKEKFHCEHVLNIYQAAVTTGLYYNGMEKDEMSNKLRGLGLNEFTATTREKDEIKTKIEDDKDDLKNTVYDVACSCCNSIKTNYMFIDFDSSKWEWIVDTDGIDKVFRGILENSTDICKHINKKTIVIERGPEISENLQSRCEILNDFFLPPNPVKLGNKQRQRYYNLLTLSNLLITFRPKNLQKLIKKIMKGGRDMNVIPQQTVFPDMGDMGNKIMEYETNIGKKDTVVNNEEPKINQANETLKQTIIKLVQDDLDERQQKLDTFFEYFEKSVAQYQKEHPEVIQGRKEFDEIIKNNPDAFKDGRPNPKFWLNRNKTGGKKTKKRRNTRTKPKKTVRKTKKNTRNKK